MVGLTHDRNLAGYGTPGIDKIRSVERRSACLALIAVCPGVVAVRAFAGHVTVGEELSGLFVIELHRGLLDKLILVVQTGEKFRRCGAMDI